MKFTRAKVMDKLHKGFVMTSIGISLYTCVCIGDVLYDYFTRVKPQFVAKQELANLDLLREGSSEKFQKDSAT